MNSSFVRICILLKSYLRLAYIYDRNSNKRKTDLIEMIVYGYISNKVSKEPIEDISINKAMSILK